MSSNQVVRFANDNEKDIYDLWANLYSEKDLLHNRNNYFDYFFSGQDIQIRIEGLNDTNDYLPIYQFGFNIQQNKQPIYGYWSYVYDYMLRGTRIIAGAFTIVTKTPGYMTEMIAKAADRRSTIGRQSGAKYSNVLHPIRGLDMDEQNIQRYWRRNFDSNLKRNQQHLFSVHPPFNFLLTYGIQDTSMSDYMADKSRGQYLLETFNKSTAMMADINERLVDSEPDKNRMRLLIENVELVSRQTEINADGDPIMETYTFMARDLIEAPNYNPS